MSNEKLQDFGEHIAGAKKETYFRAIDLSNEEIKKQPLSKLWADKDIKDIEDINIRAVAFALKESLPNKPRNHYRLSYWLDNLYRHQSMVVDLLQKNDLSYTNKQLEKISNSSAKNKAYLLPNIAFDDWKRIGKVVFYQTAGNNSVRLSVQIDNKEYSFSPKEPANIINFDYKKIIDECVEEIQQQVEQNKQDISQKNTKTKELTAQSFDIYTYKKDNTAFICAKNDRQKTPLITFETLAEAREYKKDPENIAELGRRWTAHREQNSITKVDMRNAVNEERTGQSYRDHDITPDEFMATFGVRGGQFGNWVTGDERQQMLNNAYDGFMDLSKALKIEPKAIGLNGTLGIAFGARGSGLASAHYERGEQVINLTKTRGAGSLAHEWWHALDHYMKNGDDLLTRHLNANSTARHQELIDPVSELVKDIKKSELYSRSQMADTYRSPAYFSTNVEMTARAFESYIQHELSKNGIKNDFLVNIKSEKDWQKNLDAYPYPKADELEQFSKAYNAVFDTLKEVDNEFVPAQYEPEQLIHADTLAVNKIEKTEENSQDIAKLLENNTAEALQAYAKDIERFNFSIDKVIGGNYNRGYIPMGRTPDVLKILGLPDTKVRIKEQHLEKVMATYLDIPDSKYDTPHNVTPDTLRKIPREIHNPIAVFKSSTRDNSYLLLTEQYEQKNDTGKNSPIVVIFNMNAGKDEIDIINIGSIYGRSNHQLIRDFTDNLLYINTEKGQKFLNTERLQLPWDFTSDTSNLSHKYKTEYDLCQYILDKERTGQFLAIANEIQEKTHTAPNKELSAYAQVIYEDIEQLHNQAKQGISPTVDELTIAQNHLEGLKYSLENEKRLYSFGGLVQQARIALYTELDRKDWKSVGDIQVEYDTYQDTDSYRYSIQVAGKDYQLLYQNIENRDFSDIKKDLGYTVSEQQNQIHEEPKSNIATQNTYINCPYAEKNQAKALGAKWDWNQKSWYVPAGLDLNQFSKWYQPTLEAEQAKLNITVKNFDDDLASKEVQDRAIHLATHHTQALIDTYKDIPETYNGRYIASDMMKEVFNDFNQSPTHRNLYNNAVHNSAASLAAEHFKQMLNEPITDGRDTVLFLTGCPGAGKTSSVMNSGKLDQNIKVVFEGQLANAHSNPTTMEKIQQAIDKGFNVEIVAVNPLPEQALENTFKRYYDPQDGRGAPISTMARIQGNTYDGLKAIHDTFGDQIKLSIVDKPKGNKESINYHGWEHLNVLKSQGTEVEITQRLESHLLHHYAQGNIDYECFKQSAGSEQKAKYLLDSRMARQNDRGTQENGDRREISSGSSEPSNQSQYIRGNSADVREEHSKTQRFESSEPTTLSVNTDRTYLYTTPQDYEELKSAGARFDSDYQVWYFSPAQQEESNFSKWLHRPTVPDYKTAFVDYLKSQGIQAEVSQIIDDGRTHRLSNEGSNDKNVQYKLYANPNGIPFASITNWSRGAENQRWTYPVEYKQILDNAEKVDRAKYGYQPSTSAVNTEEKRQDFSQIKTTYSLEQKEKHDEMADIAKRIYAISEPVAQHNYLDKKQVSSNDVVRKIPASYHLPHDLKDKVVIANTFQDFKEIKASGDSRLLLQRGNLVVPQFNNNGEIRAFESISYAGGKYALRDAEKSSLSLTLGSIENGKPILVAEGYATGATLHEQTKQTVSICFGKNNMEQVVQQLREKYPDSRIYLAVDNDHTLEKQGKSNVGVEQGKLIESKFENIACLIPQFTADNQGKDWNDVYVNLGRNVLIEQLREQLNNIKLEQENKEKSSAVAQQVDETKTINKSQDIPIEQRLSSDFIQKQYKASEDIANEIEKIRDILISRFESNPQQLDKSLASLEQKIPDMIEKGSSKLQEPQLEMASQMGKSSIERSESKEPYR